MLTYYLDYQNNYTIRTENTGSNEFTMSLQNMYLLEDTTMSMSNVQFTSYENIFAFTGSISGAVAGADYRATLYSSGSKEAIWHGSFQVFHSQSVDKTSYETQLNQYKSNVTENRFKEYVIQ